MAVNRMFELKTLAKRGIRTDAFWIHSLARRSTLWSIPFWFDTAALLKSQYWPRAQLELLRKKRIVDVCQHAGSLQQWKSSFKKAGFNPNSFEMSDFEILPVLTKNDFSSDNPTPYTDPAYIKRSYADHTSGSTGRPFPFYIYEGAELRSYAVCERMFRAAGNGMRFPVVSMRTRDRIAFAISKYTFFFIRGAGSIPYRYDDLVREIGNLGGAILYGFSSSLVRLAQVSRGRARPSVRAIIAAGETISDGQRSEIKHNLGADVFLCYSTRELGWLAFECEKHRMHINEEWAYIEIVDEKGKPLPEDCEGRIVVTTFDNRCMPFIRYDTGDKGRISNEACPCGRTLQTIHVRGRDAEFIETADGRILSVLDVSSTFDASFDAIQTYQILQKSETSFTIRVVPGPAFEEEKDAIARRLVRKIHPNASITWEVVHDIEQSLGGKAAYFKRI